MGQPPQTQQDFWVIRGVLRKIALDTADPNDGYQISPALTASAEGERKAAAILAGVSICAIIMALASGIRLAARLFRPSLKWGLDDWMLIPATVGDASSVAKLPTLR